MHAPQTSRWAGGGVLSGPGRFQPSVREECGPASSSSSYLLDRSSWSSMKSCSAALASASARVAASIGSTSVQQAAHARHTRTIKQANGPPPTPGSCGPPPSLHPPTRDGLVQHVQEEVAQDLGAQPVAMRAGVPASRVVGHLVLSVTGHPSAWMAPSTR